VDFCYRARRAGFRLVVNPRARVWHKVSAASGGASSCTFIYYSFRNKLLFLKKNLNASRVIYYPPVVFRCAMRGMRLAVTGQPRAARVAIQGLADGLMYPWRSGSRIHDSSSSELATIRRRRSPTGL
jgi:GT2 family glycosyltransferase